jgi:hypothetical protein
MMTRSPYHRPRYRLLAQADGGAGGETTARGARNYRRASNRHGYSHSIFPITLAVVLFGFAALEFGPLLVGCGIKGNISVRTGERIYHLPGQKYYFMTRINWLRGERWFCSEADARAAGWRKARI